MDTQCKNINLSEDLDPLESLVGKVCCGKTVDNRLFFSRLIEIRDNGRELWFETKNGRRVLNKRDALIYLAEAL